MGKGNRERLRRESDNLTNADAKAVKAKQKQKGVPLWAGNMILGAIGLLLVVVIVVSTVSSSGLIFKLTKYASTNSYELSGTQMTYIFKTLYNNFVAQNSSYISYLISSDKSLKDQQSLYTDDEGNALTWFDYFAKQTEAEAEQLLVLCELAKSEGLDKISEDEEKEIEDALNSIATTATQNGYSYNGFIKAMYGAGVSEKDIVTVMTYQTIAANYYDIIIDRLGEKVTEDRVNTYFDEHKKDFLKVDYLKFSFNAAMTVLGATASSEDKLKAEENYNADKALVDKYYAEFEKVTTVDGFKTVLIEYLMEALAEDSFEDLYEEEFDDIKEDLLPSEDEKKKFKEDTLKKLKEELLKLDLLAEETEEEEEEDNKTDSSADDKKEEAKTEVQKAEEAVWEEILEVFTDKVKSVFLKEASYNGSTTDEDAKALADWLFADDAKENSVKGEKPEESSTDTKKTYAAAINMIVKTPYRVTDPTKDVGHILISASSTADKATLEEAEKKANELLKEFLKGDKTKDAFEKLAKENTADSGVFYEMVKKGDMVKEFEDWLFDEARKDGDTDVVKTEYGYHVMYFLGTNNEEWYCDVYNTVLQDDYTEWFETAKTTAGIEINQNSINKIPA